MRRAPAPPPHRLEWRAQGAVAWEHVTHYTPITEADARAQFRHRVANGIGGPEQGRPHEARLWRNGVCVAAWVEDGR